MSTSIADLIKKNPIQKPKQRSERAEITEQVFNLYKSSRQVSIRKKENWKRYCEWCRENRKGKGIESQKLFKKSKKFIKEWNITTFVFFISHIPTKDLYFLLSTAKDMENRSQSIGGYIGGLRTKNQFSTVAKF